MEGEKPALAKIPITKKHYSAMAHKINTDKLRDMLREKCQIRVKELRHKKFDVSRQFMESEKQWLTEMLKGELTELEMDMLLEDKILHELIDEQYQWMIEQYYKSLDDELTHDPRSLLVMCPICEIAELEWNNHLLSCSCGFQQWYNGSLEDFWKTIQKKVTEHEEKCTMKLTFFMDPTESALNLLCNNCDFLALIK